MLSTFSIAINLSDLPNFSEIYKSNETEKKIYQIFK